MQRLRSAVSTGSAATQTGLQAASEAGRWIKLTPESAALKQSLGLMPTSTPGVSHVMIGRPGGIQKWVQVENATKIGLLAHPAGLVAAAAMMQQYAMQQQMDQMIDYLQEINEKVDDILRNQTVAVISSVISVRQQVDEAVTLREQTSRVSEVSWSKIQSAPPTVTQAQAYALLQLDGLSTKITKKTTLGAVAKETRKQTPTVREWLAILAETVRLQMALAVLELERVNDAYPQDLDSHRRGLQRTHTRRSDEIGAATGQFLTQLADKAQEANSKVLFHPQDSPAVVKASNELASIVTDFRERLGIEASPGSTDARRWRSAAIDAGANVGGVVKQTAGDVAGGVTGALGRVRRTVGSLPGAVGGCERSPSPAATERSKYL